MAAATIIFQQNMAVAAMFLWVMSLFEDVARQIKPALNETWLQQPYLYKSYSSSL